MLTRLYHWIGRLIGAKHLSAVDCESLRRVLDLAGWLISESRESRESGFCDCTDDDPQCFDCRARKAAQGLRDALSPRG